MNVEKYLVRIGLPAQPPEPTRAALDNLQRAHLMRVPYENLDILAGQPISLTPRRAIRQDRPSRAGRLLLRAEMSCSVDC